MSSWCCLLCKSQRSCTNLVRCERYKEAVAVQYQEQLDMISFKYKYMQTTNKELIVFSPLSSLTHLKRYIYDVYIVSSSNNNNTG